MRLLRPRSTRQIVAAPRSSVAGRKSTSGMSSTDGVGKFRHDHAEASNVLGPRLGAGIPGAPPMEAPGMGA